tara:strand:+ start:1474 stop:1758 length:285 start_codon:yes stop_codon:yes gene_type:complete
MKRGKNSTNRLEWATNTKINILEKNPNKGGTPAIDNRVTLSVLVKKLAEPKSESEKSVLTFVLAICNSVEKSKKEVKLYIIIYVRRRVIVWRVS